MGYTLRIGELKTSIDEDGLYSYIRNEAKLVSLDNAPAFGEPTDYENSRWPSYTTWSKFCKFVNLEDLFYHKEYGLLRSHPGCVPLVKEHKEIIDDAYEKFYEAYPNCEPGFSQNEDDSDDWPDENAHGARLEWLKFWIDWALDGNCKNPVFYNH